MAYTHGLGLSEALVRPNNNHLTAENLAAAAADYQELLVLSRVRVTRIMFMVTTLVAADTTAPVVTFTKRPTYNSSTDESTIGTLTIPDTTAVGKVVYKDVDPVILNPGDGLLLDHTTQAADASSAAGAGYYGLEYELCPDDARNLTDMVESA